MVLPMLAIFGIQLFTWPTFLPLPFEEEDPGVNPKWEVANAMEYGYPKSGYVALSNIDEFNDSRKNTLETYVFLKDMLNEGESLPAIDRREIIATGKASVFARKECDLIKQVLAKKCAVIRTRAKHVGNDIYRLNLTFLFTQKAPFGTVDASKEHSYLELDVSQHSMDAGADYPVSHIRIKDIRRNIYRVTAGECERLNQENGNCAISGLTILSKLGRNQDTIKYWFSTSHSVIQQL